tara:strand:- start:61 stop:828 length:768 start_codon:yes stop_codon:yes gene_type:complete
MIKNSLIYNGKVIHKRFKPKEHYFKYNVFSLLIDLDELDIIQNKIKIFSYNKFNIISFFDIDHGPRDGTSIRQWISKNLKDLGINDNKIKIKLLCYPRIFGYVFNPLSVFFIYDKNLKLISIFYEVKNTFGEQHTYLFKASDDKTIKNNCSKKFHVSPFIEMECNYYFRVLKPSDKMSVIIDQSDNSGKLLYASQDGVAKELNQKNLIISYICHPLMTFKIIAAIHFEAFKLWLKGIKFVKKKFKISNNISIEEK